ncbi:MULTISPECIES: carboxylating nicotinate-nucleotide diphosphorylase [unclassified Streptomyces]|uniref:carboxylating nicotinate-nucleotide diphosphorylase n=1 Tax=unclassified Streptomyces TaxID=2593676 RepID=UPI00087EA207|nr:carboxylating nicotinate-nucleotide diphosphorylase [Streptomyces sp. 136MFCol5.1]SCY11755.1 nicotinate-nucleotide pyrophosphorylase [carboxylating] [Streptomyces sp. 136MFCol5.1]
MNEIDTQVRESAVRTALAEDCAGDDVTTLWAVPADARAHARILARQDGVVAGLPLLGEVYRQLGHDVEVSECVKDGERVQAGQSLAELTGPSRAIITGERTALNFLQRMSGIATHAAAFVDAVAGLSVRILDTRKTAPGLRALDKYAVATAGASNHRLDLAAMVLLKENHIAVAGGVGAAVAAIRAHNAAGIAVEVEVESVAQAAEALRTGVEWIMLDNLPIEDMRHIVTLRGSQGPRLEASGSITLDTVRAVAETGVDAISVGAISHSAPAFDLTLLLTPTAPADGGHPVRFG